MSAKRKKSSLSASSDSGSNMSDEEQQLKMLSSKKQKPSRSGGSSGESDGGQRARSKSRSRSGSGSGSGSDSGTAKSRSGSGSRSRSASGSPASRKGSGSDKKSGSSSGSDSGTGGSDGGQKKKSASDASHNSSGSEKGKKLLKASERKASSKYQSTLSNDSDSEQEDSAPKMQKIPKLKKNSQNDSDDNTPKTWRNEFDDGLDSDLVGDDDDRENLEEMTEKQREEELFKRAEKREELKKRFEISQKLKLQQKNKKDSSVSMDSNSDNEKDVSMSGYPIDSTQARRKGYEEKHAKKFSALNNLKAMREERERKENERKEKERKNKKRTESGSGSDLENMGKSGKNKKLKASDIYSSSSSDGGGNNEVRRKSSSSSSSSSSSVSSISSGESDTERHKSKKIVKKAKVIELREELEKIRLSRFKIDKFVHLPIFKKTVVGCFVRIGIGHNKERDVPVYRVAEITDVCETAKVYDVMKNRTNIGLRMRHGKQERVFRAQFISNQPFTENEFQKWRQTCEVEHVELPSNQVVEDKVTAIQKALTYRFSNYDVEKILASKEKFSKHPVNYAVRKAKLMKEKGQALDDNNAEAVERLDTQLAELEERAEELDRKRTSTISTISLINDRNRKNNISRAEKGILQEKRKVAIEGHVNDPFTRRKTTPMLSTNAAKKEEFEEEGEMTTERLLQLEKIKAEKIETDKKEREIQMEHIRRKMNDEDMPVKKNVKKNGVGGSKATTQDIFNAHDFDIDINVSEMTESMLPSSIAVKPVTTSAGPSMGPTKRSLKIEEWKKRKGII